MSSAISTSDEVDTVQRSLSTGLPQWCSYQGVTCGTVSGSATYASVTSIKLASLSLTGTIPSSIGSLTSLQYFYLYTNKLSGTIPSSIGSLTSLQYLKVYKNSLSGTIPSSIGSLTLLNGMDLSSNILSGTIPGSVGLLILLQYLHLESNRLAGTIPSSFNKLTRLSDLELETNYLTMGSATTVSKSVFSSTTLSGTLTLSSNCLAFTYGSISVSVTHCAPTSGTSVIQYEYVLSCLEEQLGA